MRRLIKINIICLSLLSNPACFAWTWHPVATLTGGIAASSQVGTSQQFPIVNPASDELYQYSPNHATQTSALIGIFIGAESPIYPAWIAQVGLDYNQAAPFSTYGRFSQGADAQSANTYNYHYGVLTRQLLIEGKFLYTFKEKIHPYLLVGLGASFNKAYNYYTNVPPTLTFTRLYQNNSNTSFSYALGLGIDGDISPVLRLGIGYRFTDLGQVKLGQARIDTTPVSGTLSQSHLYANEILVQLTYLI